jgi:hypothetical protein
MIDILSIFWYNKNMENTRSNSPSIPTILDGIKAADIKVNYGPDLPSDQEVVEYFNERRPDTWPIIPPEEELNPQQREALAVFDNADNLREDPSYKIITTTSRMLVEAEARRLSRQKTTQVVDKCIKSGMIAKENRDRLIDRYAKVTEGTTLTLRRQVSNNALDEDSLLCEYLQPGASNLGRLAILECLGFSEASVRGAISCGSIDDYESKKSKSEEFFALTDKGREEKLKKLLKQSEYAIRRQRADREKREQEAALEAAYKKMFGDDLEGATRRIERDVESLRQDGYTLLSSAASLMHSREKAGPVAGSLGELRQAFPDLCYPSGLNALDCLAEECSADTKMAVLVGAQVMGSGKVYALGTNLATIYKKSDSSEG